MLWRLPASVRSLSFSAPRGTLRAYSADATMRCSSANPLRILFCGSDNFSVASLRALDNAKREVSGLIHSVDVVHRPAKHTGRGLKTLKEVPVAHVATEELKLATHVIDTFTGWTPPVPIDLIIAVSFGLFVPPRILSLAKYGGINVHPSLLPDLRGPAPIEHAILKRRERTGVSVQTLHPEHFDQGTILAQAPAPGIQINRNTIIAALQDQLAQAGAQMLVDVLKHKKYISPHEDVGWYANSSEPIDHAPKITKQDRFVDFDTKTMDDIQAMHLALGDLWLILPNGQRLVIHKTNDIQKRDAVRREHNIWKDEGFPTPFFRAACGRIGMIVSSTYAGQRAGQGNRKAMQVLFKQDRTW
ncbi:methionyl-tRNA formyltransferase [Setomelanomma holmii]|uniref:methionyl-tRNA formyltransferase n=1 Tax=Setomelanomma holmii TaxID=210430 RepID=A0A9P4GYY9_9PLEO|nr:methionyl-tRNA formyltransferase [Setomelanomma holmii]